MEIARKILKDINQIMRFKREVNIALSGGSTPIPLYRALCSEQINWSNVTFTLIDDRIVPFNHEASNSKLIKDTILNNHAKNASIIDLHNWSKDNIPDLAIIGMGKDGHFASLFPNMHTNKNALDPKVAPDIFTTEPNGNPFHARITMNLAMIIKIPRRYLVLDSEKIKILFRDFEGKDLPITRLLSFEGTNIIKL